MGWECFGLVLFDFDLFGPGQLGLVCNGLVRLHFVSFCFNLFYLVFAWVRSGWVRPGRGWFGSGWVRFQFGFCFLFSCLVSFGSSRFSLFYLIVFSLNLSFSFNSDSLVDLEHRACSETIHTSGLLSSISLAF